MADINLFNRWKVKRWVFWLVVAGVPAVCLISFVVLSVFPVGYGSAYNLAGGDTLYALEPPAAGFGLAEGEYAQEEAMDDAAGFAAADGDFAESATVSTANQAIQTDRLIIRDGNINISVEDTRDTRDAIEALVGSMADKGAYVISATESGRGESLPPYISMVIRVPVEEFDRALDQIAEMGIDVLDRNESGQDVTEEYVDLAGRVEALEAARDRLLDIMIDADTTEDLLKAEAQLTVREAEIESLKGRMQYLSESARLSRIAITLTPYTLSEPIDTSWKPAETFRRAVEDLVESMQGFADFLIVFGIAVLPWIVFFGLIIWGVVAVVRRRRAKKAAKAKE